MKLTHRTIASAALLILSVAAYCQHTADLAKCLGSSRDAYAKAFDDKTTWVKDSSTVGEYKTDEAKIDVIQTKGAKTPNVINVFFYQQPERDWKLALRSVGLSSEGVVAKKDAKGYIQLSKIKAKKGLKIAAYYVPLSSKNPDGPELHLKLVKP